MFPKKWANPIFVGFLILFSVPIKLPALQQMLESLINYSLPIRLSLYTLILPPVAFFSIVWNRKRAHEIWKSLHLPLIVLFFLFFWMWIGAIFSDYPEIALKHSGRYSLYLLTFLAFLFAIEEDSLKKSYNIFIGIYILLIFLTFLDLQEQINIQRLLLENGFQIDLFFRDAKPSSFFENRNPYSIASVGVLFLCISRFSFSVVFNSIGILAALYSIFISGSRNGLLTLIIVLILFFAFNFKNLNKTLTTFIIIFTVIISVVSIFLDMKNPAVSRTKETIYKLMTIKSYNDLEILDIRFSLLRYTIRMGIENTPILGSGSKTFGYEIIGKSKNLNQFNSAFYKNSFNSHNPFTTIWIEMGWVGLIATILFLWLWFRKALRAPPIFLLPLLAVCIGQIVDYFVWEILFMAFQSFFFAHFAVTIKLRPKISFSK